VKSPGPGNQAGNQAGNASLRTSSRLRKSGETMGQATSRELIWKHVKQIGTCMMVTVNADGGIRSRPMRGTPDEAAGAIWFFSDRDTDKDEDVARDPRACLTFADTHDQTYVSLSGRLSLIHDRNEIAAHWNAAAEAYYPNGKDDNSIVLMKFSAGSGEYWDAPSSPIVMAIKFLQAKVSGERPDLGTQGSARLS
jgi:general stress protein 26